MTNASPALADTPVTILGIETSCDDTAVAIIRAAADGRAHILANQVWSQHAEHAAYGGVVPEIAARSHVERLDSLIAAALAEAGLGLEMVDAVAATAGPGLIGGVVVGLTTAKAICLAHDLPLIPINHLEGHALSVRLTDPAPFPYLLLLVSGGHTQLVAVDALGTYERLGTTIDDAAGEAFDKTAKLLGLGQPGGPQIEAAATGGRANRFDFPRPLQSRPGCDFSFSGLKTAVRQAALKAVTSGPAYHDAAPLDGQTRADLAASFQAAAARHLADRTSRAMAVFSARHSAPETGYRLVVAGGVAANCTIKAALNHLCQTEGWSLIVPPPKFCTDNGAMIAQAGLERFQRGLVAPIAQTLAMPARARWPLAEPMDGAPRVGGGKKGPKA
ncbi:MAG: tRNA (adenosine(37)-N6)-threonylcarbamoyltransferase complex transferase subunit TsaD [Pseudomonadota bacterium]